MCTSKHGNFFLGLLLVCFFILPSSSVYYFFSFITFFPSLALHFHFIFFPDMHHWGEHDMIMNSNGEGEASRRGIRYGKKTKRYTKSSFYCRICTYLLRTSCFSVLEYFHGFLSKYYRARHINWIGLQKLWANKTWCAKEINQFNHWRKETAQQEIPQFSVLLHACKS